MCDESEEFYALLHRVNFSKNWLALDLWMASELCDQSLENDHAEALATWMLDSKQSDHEAMKQALGVNDYGKLLVERAIARINGTTEAIVSQAFGMASQAVEDNATVDVELEMSTCAQIALFMHRQWQEAGTSMPFTEWLNEIMWSQPGTVLITEAEGDR
jgi:hypothetical protein